MRSLRDTILRNFDQGECHRNSADAKLPLQLISLPGPNPYAAVWRTGWPVLAITLGMVVSGCSVNGIGFATSEVIRANGAVVILTTTFGAALRTGPDDAGLAIGYTKTLAVAPDSPVAPPPGSYVFGVSAADLPPVAVIRRVIGIDFGLNREMVGATLGFSEDAVFARLSSDTSVLRHLVLLPDDPAGIELRLCREPVPCE
jgi:hypothetical protein